jgi:hypothetical protein
MHSPPSLQILNATNLFLCSLKVKSGEGETNWVVFVYWREYALAIYTHPLLLPRATVVRVLVEVPVMLTVCSFCNRTKSWFPSPQIDLLA